MPGDAYSSFTVSVCRPVRWRDLMWCSARTGSTSPFSSGLWLQQKQLLQSGLSRRGAENRRFLNGGRTTEESKVRVVQLSSSRRSNSSSRRSNSSSRRSNSSSKGNSSRNKHQVAASAAGASQQLQPAAAEATEVGFSQQQLSTATAAACAAGDSHLQ